MSFIFLNGEFIPDDQASIPLSDQGFLTGHGIFETIKVTHSAPQWFDQHFERLTRSAHQLGLISPDRSTVESAISRLLEKNQLIEARLRITLTGRPAPFPQRSDNPTLAITTGPLPVYPNTATVMTVPFTRNETGALTGIKSISYGENLLALQYAQERGFDEAIFTNTKGHLCEGATTNIFLVIGDRLLTPNLKSGCLPGTTRCRVLKQAKHLGIPCKETEIPLPLSEVDAAFLTSSLRGIQPIRKFDDRVITTSHSVIAQLREAS